MDLVSCLTIYKYYFVAIINDLDFTTVASYRVILRVPEVTDGIVVGNHNLQG